MSRKIGANDIVKGKKKELYRHPDPIFPLFFYELPLSEMKESMHPLGLLPFLMSYIEVVIKIGIFVKGWYDNPYIDYYDMRYVARV